MLPEITQEEFSAALDACAIELLAEADVEVPIDAAVVARKLELQVALSAEQHERGRFMRLHNRRGKPQGSIVLRPEDRPERLQWSLAHEIGEATAHRVFDALGVRPAEAPAGAREAIANMLAARILLPRDPFHVAATAAQWDLFSLKQTFTTASHELIARRMLDFEPATAITIWDNGRRIFRRANVGRRAPPITQRERRCRERAHTTGTVVVEEAASVTLHVWPIHEPQWKREILRTAWEEVADAADWD